LTIAVGPKTLSPSPVLKDFIFGFFGFKKLGTNPLANCANPLML